MTTTITDPMLDRTDPEPDTVDTVDMGAAPDTVDAGAALDTVDSVEPVEPVDGLELMEPGARFQRFVGWLAPIGVLVSVLVYAYRRARHGRNDRGASTVETIIWSGIALALALAVGAVLIAALRARANTVGNDIQNTPIPGG